MDKINPIISLVLTLLIAVLGWFLNMNYQKQEDTNRVLHERITRQKETEEKSNMDFEKRLSLIEYIIRTKNGRFQ